MSESNDEEIPAILKNPFNGWINPLLIYIIVVCVSLNPVILFLALIKEGTDEMMVAP